MDTELFSLMLPLLAIVLAIGSGARTLAGEEETGRLELVLAYPVSRRGMVAAKAAAVAVEVTAFCSIAYVALALASRALRPGTAARDALPADSSESSVLALLHGWLAIATGAVRPSRALAIGVPAAAAAAGYLVGGLHELAGWLDPFRVLSPFWLVGSSPLQSGSNGWGLLAVMLLAVLVLGVGSRLVERRDLQTP